MAEQNEPKRQPRIKGALRKFASNFVEFEGEDNTQQTPVTESQQPTQPAIIPLPTTVAPSPTDGNGQVPGINQEVLDKLGDIITARNLPGPDYFELVQAADSIANAGTVERENQFTTAFKVIKSMNPEFTKEIVINSIDTYLGVLDEAHDSAMNELKEMWDRNVTKPESELKSDEEEMAKLQARLQELTVSVQTKRQQIEAAKVDNQQKQQSFEFTFNFFRGKFEEDKDFLNKVLNSNL